MRKCVCVCVYGVPVMCEYDDCVCVCVVSPSDCVCMCVWCTCGDCVRKYSAMLMRVETAAGLELPSGTVLGPGAEVAIARF